MGSEIQQAEDSADVRLEVDGTGVSPDSVDARSILELAGAYFELLAKVAKSQGSDLHLKGLSVIDKCVVIATTPSSPVEARNAADLARDYIAGRVPHGLVQAVRRVKDAVRSLPDGHTANVIIGPWRHQLPRSDEPQRLPPYANVMMRARPIRVGGANPKARFMSDSEESEFSLDVTADQARELGPHLYKDIDISATVLRDEDDVIRGGKLEEMSPLDDEPPELRDVMRGWLRQNAPQWADIDDVEAELKRD